MLRVTKRIIPSAIVFAGIAAVAFGQPADKKKLMSANPQSPPMETSVTINGKQIWIVYHAPSVRGRKIFGGDDALQKNGTQWRAGADWATTLHTDADLDIHGIKVAPGDYTLFIDLDQGKWNLIVNKQTGQWGIKRGGAANFDPANDVGRAPMTMGKPSAPLEQMKIELSSAGGNNGKLQLEWENVVASVPFTVK